MSATLGPPDKALTARWRALHDRATSKSAAEGPEFVTAALHAAGTAEAGRELLILAVSRGNELIALWPAFREVRHGRRWLVPPGFGASEEYSGPLTIDGPDALDACRLLMDEAARQADVLFFTVPAEHPAGAAARAQLRFVHAHDVHSPAISLPADPSIETWLTGKSGSFRKGLRYDLKQLKKLGEVRLFVGKSGDPRTAETIAWIFDEKRAWLKARGSHESWLFSDRASNLVQHLFAEGRHSGGVWVYALTVNDDPVAGAICLEGSAAIELSVFVINPAYKAHSPGNLLLKELVEIAFSEGKQFDFRITSETYKLRWADSEILYRTYVCANGINGVPAVAKEEWHVRKVSFRRNGRRWLEETAERRPWMRAFTRLLKQR